MNQYHQDYDPLEKNVIEKLIYNGQQLIKPISCKYYMKQNRLPYRKFCNFIKWQRSEVAPVIDHALFSG
ncbi:hypothetical protein EB796_013478 [Bugula neritina]|uniref:Uncharacterized protein n=1 Tax=Bugula neritina TaxID=10212 RepID=A0A7J7JPE9_BUGNE|nr:hypothetical protein EB796_013478 [Bugula neritina]